MEFPIFHCTLATDILHFNLGRKHTAIMKLDFETSVEIRVALSQRRYRLISNWVEAAELPQRDLKALTFWSERLRENIDAEQKMQTSGL